MNTFSRLMHCDGCTDRLTYQRNAALLAVGKCAIDLVTLAVLPTTSTATVALSWLNPFALVRPWTEGHMPTMICFGTLLFFSALVWNSVHRARHAGWLHWTGLITAVPFIGPAFVVVLAYVPPKKHSVWDLI